MNYILSDLRLCLSCFVLASLDGQNSFCQNLVHWVTGCSFKKIRRVRDHLKKDPKSLPEHGLKRYWKVSHVAENDDITLTKIKSDRQLKNRTRIREGHMLS